MGEQPVKLTANSAPGATQIALVAIDLDGTLLTDSKQVSMHTVRALRRVAGRGVKVVIASARPPRSVRHVYEALGLDTLQINYNGALIWDEATHQAVYHQPIAGELVRQIVEEARDCYEEILVTCEILDRWYTDRFDQTYTTETGRLFKPDIVAPLEEFCNQPITKLLLLGEVYMVRGLEAHLGQRFASEVSIVRTDEHLLQLMDWRVSKAEALRQVAQRYGVPMEQVMAIGDAPNDLGMLQIAGVGVAMANADCRLREIADWIAPSNNDHGVLAALHRYGLCS